MNDYEKECTAPFEGMYTSEEVELNNRLFSECLKENPDYELVEDLLQQGADPLGPTAISGWGLLEHIYGDILCESQDSESVNIPRITELFLKYGMDIDNPKIPYDDDNSLHPMWMFAFVMNKNSIHALKMLLDKNISADAAGEMWGHAALDLLNIECGDPCNDEFWNNECIWFFKCTLLCASYDHVLDNDADLRRFIGYSYNNYDIHKFRAWDDFYYEFDTSHCEKEPTLYKSIVRIYEKATAQEVWKIGIRLDESELK